MNLRTALGKTCLLTDLPLSLPSTCSFRGAGISGVDVMRHLLPDCVVFICALASLIANARIVYRMSQGRKSGENTTEEAQRENAEEECQEHSGGGKFWP